MKLKNYLQGNTGYWSRGYFAPNVDAPVFRFYGRILKPDFGISGRNHETLLDFGCGQAAAVNFFHVQGFDAFGVDISKVDIETALIRYPHLDQHLAIIDPTPRVEDTFFSRQFDVVTAIQCLYYLSPADLKTRIQTLYNCLKSGGVFYATMMSTQTKYFGYSTKTDDGMRKVTMQNKRYSLDDYYVNFTESEKDLVDKFSLFQPKHVGHYSAQFRSDEGLSHHFTFVEVKE